MVSVFSVLLSTPLKRRIKTPIVQCKAKKNCICVVFLYLPICEVWLLDGNSLYLPQLSSVNLKQLFSLQRGHLFRCGTRWACGSVWIRNRKIAGYNSITSTTNVLISSRDNDILIFLFHMLTHFIFPQWVKILPGKTVTLN